MNMDRNRPLRKTITFIVRPDDIQGEKNISKEKKHLYKNARPEYRAARKDECRPLK